MQITTKNTVQELLRTKVLELLLLYAQNTVGPTPINWTLRCTFFIRILLQFSAQIKNVESSRNIRLCEKKLQNKNYIRKGVSL